MKEFLYLCSENCISWIFGLFFENAHKWKPHHWHLQDLVCESLMSNNRTNENSLFPLPPCQPLNSTLYARIKGTIIFRKQCRLVHSRPHLLRPWEPSCVYLLYSCKFMYYWIHRIHTSCKQNIIHENWGMVYGRWVVVHVFCQWLENSKWALMDKMWGWNVIVSISGLLLHTQPLFSLNNI